LQAIRSEIIFQLQVKHKKKPKEPVKPLTKDN
jgi:hypothetical protein